MIFSIFDVLRFFEAPQMLFFKLLLTFSWRRLLSYRNQWFLYDNGLSHERIKMGKKWRKILSLTYSLKFKNIILFLNRYLYIFFSNGHIRNVVSTLSKVVKISVKKHNVDMTLCDAATSYHPKSNVEPTFKCLLGSKRGLSPESCLAICHARASCL